MRGLDLFIVNFIVWAVSGFVTIICMLYLWLKTISTKEKNEHDSSKK